MYNIYLSVFSQTFRTIQKRLNINSKLIFVKTYQDILSFRFFLIEFKTLGERVDERNKSAFNLYI